MKKILKKLWLKESRETVTAPDHVATAQQSQDATLPATTPRHDQDEPQTFRHHHAASQGDADDRSSDGDERHADSPAGQAQDLTKVVVAETFDAISPKPQDATGQVVVTPAVFAMQVLPGVIETADAAANTGTLYQLQVGQTAQGTVGFTGDRDWFAVDLQAGQVYSFAMVGTGSNNVVDPFLRLMGPGGTLELASDDDSLPGGNSLFTFTPTSAGRYYAVASSFGDTGTGQYGVSVTAGSRPSLDVPMGAGVLDTDSAWTGVPGTGAVVTYAFRNSPAPYTVSGSDISTFTKLTVTEMAAVRLALKTWSEVSGISFVEVNPGGYSDNATMLFANYSDATDGAGAFAFFPGSTAAASQAGDVWLNTGSVTTTALIDYGSYAFNAIVHEIGHALGLSHPGLYNAAPGVSITYGANAQFTQDTNQFTVMSYFDEANTGAQFLGYPESPMLFDVYAVQQIYGANFSTRTGDSVYGFNSNTGAPFDFSTNFNPAFTIWDAGGNDTLDASGYSGNQVIDLNPGAFSSIGNLTNNIAIAIGAQIENAIGGFGNDTITGNAANNTLSGGAGADVISGADGNDSLNGGAGNDTLLIGRGQDTATGGADLDTFQLDLVANIGPQGALITDLALGEAISWSAFQTSLVSGLPVTLVGPIVAGSGTATTLNHIEYAAQANTTVLYFGLDATPGADFTLSVSGLLGLSQFTIEQNNASGALLRVQALTTAYSLSPSTVNVSESGGSLTFTVTRAGETPAETLFVSTTTGEGSANAGDFTAIADQAITFAAGELTKTVTVAITNDTVFENSESFGLVVQRNTADADNVFLAKSTFTILDDDPQPTSYSLSPVTTSVSEGVGTITFTVTRTGSTAAETIFASTTTTEGFANNADFTALADQAISFAAGELTKTVTVTITNDTVVESTETFGLVVQRSSTDPDSIFLAKSTFTILDNDTSGPDTTPPVLASSTPADDSLNVPVAANIVLTFNEAVKAGTGNLRLVNLTTGTSTLFAVTDTTQVSFSGNTLTLNPSADLLPGNDYELRVPLAGIIKDLAGNSFAPLANPINFSTSNGSTVYALSPPTSSASEGVGTMSFAITRSGSTPAETVFVSTTTTEGFANNADFTAIADQAITFAVGETTKLITVAITNDTVFETTETFGLVVQRSSTDADTTFLSKATFTIQDDDTLTPTTYALSPLTTSVSEGVGTVTFTVTRSGGTQAETIFASTTTGEGSANNADFTAITDQAITFAAGELTKTVTVAITNDTVFETTETFGLVVQRNATDPDTTFLAKSTFTIQDDDPQPTTYALTPATTSVSEAAGTVTFTITRSGGTPAETIFASTTTTEGSANSADFTAIADQTITFLAGELTKTVTVAITNDTVFENTETFGLVVQRNTTDPDTTFLAKSTFAILDDDPQPPTTYALSPVTTSVSESVGTVTFTVTRSGGTPAETIFASTVTTEGFANNGDYNSLSDQFVTFAAGELTKTVTIQIVNDLAFEPTETFGLVVQRNFADPDTTFLAKATFTILDDEVQPTTYALTPATTSVNEAAGTVTFTITRSGGTPAETIFASTTTTESSLNNGDFTAITDQPIVFAAGELTKTVTVSITNDTVFESLETFGLVVQRNTTDPDTTFLAKSVFTIIDDDPQPITYALSPATTNVSEGVGTVTFTVTRSASGPAETLFASTTTTEGSSNVGDFTAIADQAIVFAAGELTKTVTVAITNDTVFENLETFGLVVQRNSTDPDTTFLAKSTFTILDDDPQPVTYSMTPATTSVSEGVGTVTFTVTRSSGAAAETLFASTTTTEGFANNADFTALADQAITFGIGELTKTVTVSVTNDTVVESTETFGLVVQRNSTDLDTTFLAKSTFTILDNDTSGPDTTPPVLSSSSPADDTFNVPVAANIVLTFSEAVKAGTGNLRLVNLTTGTSTLFAVTDTTQVSFSGNTLTLNPSADLLPGNDYELRLPVAGLIKDLAGNNFAPLANPINFSTNNGTTPTTTYALSPSITSVNEAAGTLSFAITRAGGTPAETVFVSTTTGEGFANTADFTALADQAITFAAGETVKLVTVAITNDTVFEPTETFGLVVQRNATDADTTFLAKSTFSILDDDPQPTTYAVTPATTSVSEAAGTVTFTITRSGGAPAETIFASTTTGEGSANSGDFTAIADQAITFLAGELTKTVTVAITNDTVFEATETFGLVVQRNSTDADTTFLAKSTFSILDDDPQTPTTYALTPVTTSVSEGVGTITFTITRSGGTPAETIFASTTTGEGSANSGDFTALGDQAITFAAGELTKTVTVAITNDTVFEATETFGLVVQRNATDADTTFLAKSTFTILDDDPQPTTYALTPATTSVNEAAGTVTFTITRSGGTPAETIFASTTTGEGSANTADFTALADQAIAFAAGELTKTVTVAITNDTVFEPTETFGLVVQRNTTDADTTFLSKSTFTILDDDPQPVTYSMTPATTSVSEGVGTVIFTVTRSSGAAAETLFASTTTGEGFANNADFTALADQAIAFAAGELTKTVTVAITNDTVVENTETFGLVVQRSSTDADTTFLAKSTFTILDNDTSGPDTTPPVLTSSSPADDTLNVPVGANIVLTFSEAVKAGAGNLRLVNLTTGTSTLFAVTDTSQVSFSGNTLTLNPSADLLPGNDYELRLPVVGLIKDLAGNNFAPLANPINFSTGIFAFASSASALGTLSGTAGNDVLVGTAGDNILMGGLGIDTFVWTTTNGLGDGRGTDLIDATAGERLDFDLSLLQTLKLSNGGALLDGGSILAGPLHGGGMASLALTDPSTLAFDWNGDGVADLTLKFTAAPHLLTYDALHGDILVG